MGVLIFGLTVAHKAAWIGPAFGYSMQGFGLTAVSNVVVTYAVDSYLPVSFLAYFRHSIVLVTDHERTSLPEKSSSSSLLSVVSLAACLLSSPLTGSPQPGPPMHLDKWSLSSIS